MKGNCNEHKEEDDADYHEAYMDENSIMLNDINSGGFLGADCKSPNYSTTAGTTTAYSPKHEREFNNKRRVHKIKSSFTGNSTKCTNSAYYS